MVSAYSSRRETYCRTASFGAGRAIVTLLLRQRIGDWSDEHGRHGVLGMRVADAERRRRTIVVRRRAPATSTGRATKKSAADGGRDITDAGII